MVNEQTAVMVRPCHSPLLFVATMHTPPARSRMLCLNISDEIGVSVITPENPEDQANGAARGFSPRSPVNLNWPIRLETVSKSTTAW